MLSGPVLGIPIERVLRVRQVEYMESEDVRLEYVVLDGTVKELMCADPPYPIALHSDAFRKEAPGVPEP